MIRKLVILTLVMLPSFFVHSQIFEGGYVVFNNGDTVRGFILQQEGSQSPEEITFKPGTEQNTAIEYKRSRVKAFYTGRSHFHRFYVSKTMDPNELRQANSLKVAIVFDTLFLEVLQRGNTMTLYKYTDDVKIRFYYLQGDSGKPLELGYRVIREGVSYREVFGFRETFTLIAESSGKMTKELKSRILKCRYKEDALVKVTTLINGLEPGKTNAFNAEGQGFTIGGGINLASLYFYEDTRIERNSSGSSTPGIWLVGTYDLSANPATGRTILRSEIIFNTGSFESQSFDNTFITSNLRVKHSFTQKNVGLGFNAIYNFYNRKELKIFGGAGARLNYSFYDYDYSITAGTTQVRNRFAEPKKLWNSFPIRAGAVFNRKFEASVVFIPNRVLYQLGFPYGYGIRAFEAGLIYHF